jgi:omega-amidase
MLAIMPAWQWTTLHVVPTKAVSLAFSVSGLTFRQYASWGAGRSSWSSTRERTSRAVSMSTLAPKAPAFRLALCQMPVSSDKQSNIETAQNYLRRAKDAGANVAVLPECFNCPYDTKLFGRYAERMASPGDLVDAEQESEDSPTVTALRRAAVDTGLIIVGGSMPELDPQSGYIYNTSLSFGPNGAMLAKHRKVHLFDVDVPDGIRFKESETLSSGNEMTVFSAPLSASEDSVSGVKGLQVGVGICYDIRFPELSMAMVRSGGASLLVFPGAFNMTTGPVHWELLARARAVDNQVFVAVCSPARWDEKASYTPWGHSTVVDPWGTIVATTDHSPELVVADIDLARLKQVRSAIPTTTQQRPDVYSSTKTL